MRLRRKRLWLILPASLAVVALISLYWWISADRLADGFAAWMAARRSEGWTVSSGTPAIGGWPWAATLTAPAVALHDNEPDIPGGVTWSADRLVLRIVLWRPAILEIAPQGTQHLRVSNGPDTAFTAKRMRIALHMSNEPPYDLDLTANVVRAPSLTIGTFHLHGELRPDAQSGAAALAFSLVAQSIAPPPPLSRTLGPRIASITADGALGGPLPNPQNTLAQRATDWRDGGGTVELQHIALVWGPLDLSGSATLSLDDQLQPMGTGVVHVVGYAETLDTLAARGLLTKPAATTAKAVLSLLAQVPDDNSAPEVEVPLTLQYRTLSMRQVPLVRLPEVDWP
jgi:hypothetical protein